MTSSAGDPARWLSEARSLLGLAAPLIFVYLGNQFLSVVDTAVVGRYSEIALAGTGLGNSIFFVVFVLGMGLMLGLDPLVTQAVGAGEHRTAQVTWTQGLWLAALCTAPLILLAIGAGWTFEPGGIDPQVAEEARGYLVARSTGVLPFLTLVGARSYLQAYDITRPLVIGTVVANVLNIPLSVLLVFGDASLEAVGLVPVGLPALGAAGAGWTSSACTYVQAFVVLAAALRQAGSGGPIDARPDRTVLSRAVRLGYPIALTLIAEVGSFAATTYLAGVLGPRPLASHQVALLLAGTTFQVPLAIGTAATVRVGHAVGRGDGPGARRAGFSSLAITLAMMGLLSALFLALPQQLARLVTDEGPVIAAAVSLITVAAAFQIVDGLQINAAGALRGLGDTRSPVLANLLGHYLVGLPLGCVLAFSMGWGARGLWFGLSAGLTIVAVALTFRFERLSRRSVARA